MAKDIPETHHDIFYKKSFAHIATLMPDGTPHVVPVWVDYDGRYVLINSAKGRRKDRNMQARAQVALSVQDPDNPYRMVAIRGHVVSSATEGARQHADKLAKKYQGVDKYGGPPDEVRIIYRIEPEHVAVMG